ncbi:MAG: hypothetical protein IPH48_18420 [bacterium]|nr:hypothetical protein [bacterium]
MKTTINGLRGRCALTLMLPLLLAAGMFLGGCESDATAPQEPAPQLSEREAASQAGLVAMAVVQVGPEVITFNDAGKTVYERSFIGDVSGTIFLDFRMGSADGASATWVNGTWVRLYTAAGEPLNIPIGESGSAQMVLDINAALNRTLNTAVVGGGGSFASGPYAATFSFTNLAIAAANNYPTGGSMTFNGAGFVMTVTFNGTNTATLVVQGHGTWSINLDTGAVTAPV